MLLGRGRPACQGPHAPCPSTRHYHQGSARASTRWGGSPTLKRHTRQCEARPSWRARANGVRCLNPGHFNQQGTHTPAARPLATRAPAI